MKEETLLIARLIHLFIKLQKTILINFLIDEKHFFFAKQIPNIEKPISCTVRKLAFEFIAKVLRII